MTDRISFLSKAFNVIDSKLTLPEVQSKILPSEEKNGFKSLIIKDKTGKLLAIYSENQYSKLKEIKKISVFSDVFNAMVKADPTNNKICLNWMLNVFFRLIKDSNDSEKESAIRFVNEDLPQASKYLTLFEANKRKKKFKHLCEGSYILDGIKDCSDINQYKSLSQLFDAVDPFIEKDVSVVEKLLQKFVDKGEAEIPVKDRKFTLFIPKTLGASEIFDSFASWCTANKGNGMFKSYTSGHKKPNGDNSNLYIIINNDFFTGKTKEMYQIHFETDQLKNNTNGSNVDIFENVLSKSDGLLNYFHKELLSMATALKNISNENKYLNYLIKFGFAECLFEIMDKDSHTINLQTKEIPRIPDISKFKQVKQFTIPNAKIVELHPSIGKLSELVMIALSNNRIKELPKEIGNLKNLHYLNLTNNPIKIIPDEIKYLDKSNGGSLQRIYVTEEKIGKENYKKLKRLLPNTLFE